MSDQWTAFSFHDPTTHPPTDEPVLWYIRACRLHLIAEKLTVGTFHYYPTSSYEIEFTYYDTYSLYSKDFPHDTEQPSIYWKPIDLGGIPPWDGW